MIVVFFSRLRQILPGFDRFITGFGNSSLLAYLLLLSRHHGAHEGTPAWTKAKVNLHQVGDPIKRQLTCSSTDIYHVCRTRHFRWKGQCDTEIQLLRFTHHMIDDVVPVVKRWRRSGAVRLTRSASRKKLARGLSRPGVGATAILATKITWWHCNADGDCSRFKL